MSAGDGPFMRPSGPAALFTAAKQVIIGVLLTNVCWWRAQWRMVQPWRGFLDATKMSQPRSIRELRLRIWINGSRFSRNYILLFLGLLSCLVLSSPVLLLTVMATAGVSVALKVHAVGNKAVLRGANMGFSKGLRVIIMTATTILFVYGMSSALVWSFGLSLPISIVHSAAFTRPTSHYSRAPRNRRRLQR